MSGDGSCREPAVGCNQTFNLEPHVAEMVFRDLLKDAGVEIFFSAQVGWVKAVGKVISGITLTDGRVFEAKVWIDASYEGDLLARAG